MMKKLNLRLRQVACMFTVSMAFGLMLNVGERRLPEAEAATEQTVNLRIIGTTDIHGQLNSKDYEKGVDYNNGGLARLSNLIMTTKSEVPDESVITLDAGDTLYDYTTEYIFSENQEEIQPIYREMAKIGYDAITLGNHDFDYGYDYILKQLRGSGLMNVTVLSNVTDSKTGGYPFLENLMITRTLTSSTGKKIPVKIGILGLTIPTLTGKTHSYAGILKSEDIVINAEAGAKKLKDMGADVIVALAHTGIGPEKPELNFKNVAYALTKLEDIDVVVCGHEHNLFPTTDFTSPYFNLPNVSKSSFLMNGKNIIMPGNRGNSLGVVDLTLTVERDGSLDISERKSQLRMVNSTTTQENKKIANAYGDWEQQLLLYSNEIVAELKEGEVIQNFFGMLGDNSAIQLLNDAKIDYAQRFVHTAGEKYQEYPIIAASTYYAYGFGSPEDYVNIRNSITESQLSSIQPYNNYVYIYTITGKQLKEWIEWSASAYETTNLASKWKSPTMNSLMEQTKLKALIREDWMSDWSSFTIFDGIDYVINPFSEPRYDISGNRMSNSSRVSSVTYRGKEVTPDMKFLLVTNKITAPTAANAGVEKQVVLNGFVRTQVVLSKYIHELSDNGSILPQLDYNWRVLADQDKQCIVRVPSYAENLFMDTPWYQKHLIDADGYSYNVANIHQTVDKIGPHIVATQVTTEPTSASYKVAVNVTDASPIKIIQYVSGELTAEEFAASGGARLAVDNTFTVSKNDTYSIYAEDAAGNKTVYRLVVDNFDDKLLASPTINTYTNRKTKITGRAEPNTKIIFETYTGTYESKVAKDGTFSYALPSQPSDTIIKVYIRDTVKNLESARVNVKVKRTGPNRPSINSVNNIQAKINGDLNDNDAMPIAVVGDIVYVPKDGGKELYMANTEIYNPELLIEEVDYSKDDMDVFTLNVPPLQAGAAVTLYGLDHISRNSREIKTVVQELGPNAPVVYEISNIDQRLSGYIPGNKSYSVDITIQGNTKTIQTEKDGSFTVKFDEQLHTGEIIEVRATGKLNGATRRSYTTMVKVIDIENYVNNKSSEGLVFDMLTDQSLIISGSYLDTGTVYLAISDGDKKNQNYILASVDTDQTGYFEMDLDEKLKAGTTIYAMTRFTDGEILQAAKTTVIEGRPEIPQLFTGITNTDKEVRVISKKDCTIFLKLDGKTYSTNKFEYDKATKQYIYTLAINRTASGTEVKVTSANLAGTSDELLATVTKVAPDKPLVKAVKAGDTSVSGTVELYNYAPEGEKQAATPKRFKNAPSKVAKTQTRIFCQIGSKVYEGSINNKGNFTIKLPELKAGSELYIWGQNKGGRGPLTKINILK